MRAKYFASILYYLPWILLANEPAYTTACSPKKISHYISVAPEDFFDHLNNYVEAKAGYFFFTSSNMRHVYDNGGADAQVSGAWGCSHWLRLYGSVEYLQKSGHSLNGHQHSSIWELPLSLGLQPFVSLYSHPCSCKKVSGYFTLGPRYFIAHIHNRSDYVDHSLNQNGLGGFANLGLLFSFNPHWIADLFGEYSYCKLHFHSSHYAAQGHSVDVGGLTFGGGLGYVF